MYFSNQYCISYDFSRKCVCVLLFIVSPPENTLHHIMAKELTLLRILRKRQLFHCNFSQNVTHPFNKPFPVPLPIDRLKNNNKRDKQFRLYCIWIPNTVYNLGVCVCLCIWGAVIALVDDYVSSYVLC